MTVASLLSAIGFTNKPRHAGDTSTFESDTIGYYSTDFSNDEYDLSSHDSSSYSSQSQGVWSIQSSHSGVGIPDEIQHIIDFFRDVTSLVGDTTSRLLSSRVVVDASAVFNEATKVFSGAVENAAEAEAIDRLEKILGDTSTAVNTATTAIQASRAYNEAATALSDIIEDAVSFAEDEELEQFFADATSAFNEASIYTVVHAASALDDASVAIQAIQASDAYKNAADVISDAIDEAASVVEDVQAIIELDLDNEDNDKGGMQKKKKRWFRRRKKVKEMTTKQRRRANKKNLKRIITKRPDLGKEITAFRELTKSLEKAKKEIKVCENCINGARLKQMEQRKKITALSEKYLIWEAVDVVPLMGRSVERAASSVIFPHDPMLK